MRHAALLGAALSLHACIIPAPQGTPPPAPKKAVAAPDAPVPPTALRLGANFSQKIEVVGATLEPSRPVPGQPVRVKLVMRVLNPVEDDYTVFVHAEGPGGDRVLFDHRPASGQATSTWLKNQIVQDDFTVTLPAKAAGAWNLFFGFWEPKSDERLTLSNPQAVRNDGNDRVLLASLTLE